MASLIKSVPANELGDRFPGREAGVISDDALTGPSELVVYVGYTTSELSALQNTVVVTQIANGPQTSVWTNYFRYAYGAGALAFMFPILILIGTATRLAAARREQRFAAMSLVGATNRQIGVVAGVDAMVGSLFGALRRDRRVPGGPSAARGLRDRRRQNTSRTRSRPLRRPTSVC